ncbi:hypothetical protein ANCCAN_14348 [Ancylostoma caninum]|uniref:RanBP2-type domain-containing protein n=1 Tax=Ancylostoma caninum TaxID=29170 RepID=A0A368GAF2_ANCCA|nr:hypothetical protein ANCCAN_14348 [Ancylostoma caninum]
MGTRHDDGGSAHEKEMRSRRILKEGEWACTDPKCAQVNAEYRNACEACGKSKPRSKNRVGKEIGKEMADKSKGLFAAEDWVCSKCGNVNWARRKTCNVCNAPKLADLEKRTGYGGGFNDRQDIEYIKRDHDDEFDEFGRKKKRKEDPNAAPPPSREIYETRDASAIDEEEEEEEGEISKYKLGSDEEDEESEEEDDEAILEKYDLTADPELAEIKIEVKRPPPRPVESDCSCSCSGGECSCEESESEKKDGDRISDHSRDKVHKSSRQRDLERSDRERSRKRSWSRDKEREKSRDRGRDRDRHHRETDHKGSRSKERERAKDRKRSRSRDRKKSRSRSRDKNRDRKRRDNMANLDFHPFQDGFSINSTNAEGFSGRIGDQNQLVNDIGDNVSTSGRKSNFLSLGFYQQFFDVETDQVLKRILNSVIPTNKNFILDFVHPMPDLWEFIYLVKCLIGPFWISVTLVFSVGVFGNIAQYIENEGASGNYGSDFRLGPFWISVTLVFSVGVFGNIAQYIENEGASGNYGSDFRLVTSSATLVFLYVVLVPVIISAILWQRKTELQYALSDLLCAYGYSLSIFVPVSILWTLDVNWFRWALIFTAVSLSGAVLAKALWPAFKSDPNKLIAYISIFAVIFLHFLLAFTFKVYFFDAAHPSSPKSANAAAVVKGSDVVGNNNSNSQVLVSAKVEALISTKAPAEVKTTTAAEKAATKAANEGGGVKVLDQSATDKKESQEAKKESQGTNPKNASQLDSSAETKAHVNSTR